MSSDLFEIIRAAAGPHIWSVGVELARGGELSRADDGERNDEISVTVPAPGAIVSPTATLYLEDEEWECSCTSRDDACSHVAAAIIALRQAGPAGLPKAVASRGRLIYSFSRQGGALAIERLISINKMELPLTTSAIALAAGRVEGPPLDISQDDITAEQVLGARVRGPVSREAAPKLLDALSRSADLRLDGKAVTTSGKPIGAVAVLEDHSDGFRLSLIQHPSITEVFSNHVVMAAGVLRPVAADLLSERERDELRDGRRFSFDDVTKLVTQVLPKLRERLPVEVRTKRLPETASEPPRPVLEIERRGDLLSVLPTVVYGDPPIARVDGERLTPLPGQKTVPLRDVRAERVAAGLLHRAFGFEAGRRVDLAGREAIEMSRRIDRWNGDVQGRAHEEFFEAAALLPRFETQDGGFDVVFEQEGGSTSEPKQSAAAGDVLETWRREGAGGLVPLLGGGFAPIPSAWLAAHADLLGDLLAARSATGRDVPNALLPDVAKLAESLGEAPPPAFERLRTLVEGFGEIPKATHPSDLCAELRPYQAAGVDWLSFCRDSGLGALLADDMGLGKTLQALAVLEGRSLVVAPTSVLTNWENEAKKFRPHLRVATYHGQGRELDPSADLTLTTYAILRIDIDRLAAERWDAVVLDEAQNVKNPDSQVARAAFRLDAGFRVALSGTPVENRLSELWSQFHFLSPGLLGTRDDFDTRYAKPIVEGDEAVAVRLRSRIRPFILRRRKQEVARDLPPRTEAVLRCELTTEERAVYDAVQAATRDEIVQRLGQGGNVIEALEALLRLRQASCHSGLVPGQDAETSSKVRLLLEELEMATAEGHKALVFSQWTSLLDRVEPHLKAAGIEFARLDGSTRDRGAVVDRFQSDDGPPVMLLSLRAGGTGLNLTAADCVFLLDPWWNPAVEDQAADRAHRIGQTKPVMVYRLVAAETVEEKILALQDRKRALAEAAIGSGGAAAGLTRQDLLALLE